MNDTLILTCEHAGNKIPAAYAQLFSSHTAKLWLDSHRGYDPGALPVAKLIAKQLQLPLLDQQISRLLVEPNRSLGHRKLWSRFTHHLDAATKAAILQHHYHPHRERVREAVAASITKKERAVHIGIHSFARVLDGRRRKTDIGLLYDSTNRAERAWIDRVFAALRESEPRFFVHRNQPYRGMTDGLTTALRRELPADSYLGFEIEICQDLIATPAGCRELAGLLGPALRSALA